MWISFSVSYLKCVEFLKDSNINVFTKFVKFWSIVFFLSLFEREKAHAGKGQKERERKRVPSRFHTVSTEPSAGLELMNHDIMT